MVTFLFVIFFSKCQANISRTIIKQTNLLIQHEKHVKRKLTYLQTVNIKETAMLHEHIQFSSNLKYIVDIKTKIFETKMATIQHNVEILKLQLMQLLVKLYLRSKNFLMQKNFQNFISPLGFFYTLVQSFKLFEVN